jgi:transcriptional regulator
VARAVEDRDWVFDMLRRLTETHEAPRSVPWSVSDAPAPFMERMMRVDADRKLTHLQP